MEQMVLPGKVCTKCGTWKALSQFAARPSRPLGVQSQCLACKRASQKAARQINGDQERERRRQKYASDPALREKARQYRLANLERYRDWQREFRLNNPDRVADMNKRRRANYVPTQKPVRTPFDAKAYAREWYARNKERARLKGIRAGARRRSRIAASGRYVITPKDLRRILRAGCAVAGCVSSDLHIDHVIPLAKGGGHRVGNLQALCAAHNRSKGAKLQIEFVAHLIAAQHQND